MEKTKAVTYEKSVDNLIVNTKNLSKICCGMFGVPPTTAHKTIYRKVVAWAGHKKQHT